MRWMSFEVDGRASFGLAVGEGDSAGVVDAGSKSDFADLKEAIAADALAGLAGEIGTTPDHALADVRFLPTITNPDKILCVGLNYKAHQEETGRGGEDSPTIFVRFAEAQIGHLDDMVRPNESMALDFEGEIAMIISKRARRVAREDWLDYVAGFAPYNDGSVRDYQRHTSQFTPGKNFMKTGGFGPWMMTRDEVGDLDAIEITTRLNGEVMQNATADLMVFGFADLMAYCTTFIDLVPGDVIVTGTPGGVGMARNPPVWMDAGDVIEIDVAPIGTLRNTVIVG